MTDLRPNYTCLPSDSHVYEEGNTFTSAMFFFLAFVLLIHFNKPLFGHSVTKAESSCKPSFSGRPYRFSESQSHMPPSTLGGRVKITYSCEGQRTNRV